MKVEVQLRTIAMDFWASLEHKLRYKKEIPEAEAAQMAEELTECANVIGRLGQEDGGDPQPDRALQRRKRREPAGNRTGTDHQS